MLIFILLNLFCRNLKAEVKVPLGIYSRSSNSSNNRYLIDTEYSIGLNSCFKEYNIQESRKFEIVTIEHNDFKYLSRSLALLGCLDSSNISKALALEIPIIFPFNNDFRNISNIFTIRPTLEQEIDLLSEGLKGKISIIYLSSLEKQKDYLKSKLKGEVSEYSYINNPTNLNGALLFTKRIKPDTIIFLGDADSGLSFAKRLVRTNLKDVTFVSSSDVINSQALKYLNEYNLKIISTSIVFSDVLKDEYIKVLKKFYSDEFSNEGLEGYFVGQLIMKILEDIVNNGELNRKSLISYLNKKEHIEIFNIKLIKDGNYFKLPISLSKYNIE